VVQKPHELSRARESSARTDGRDENSSEVLGTYSSHERQQGENSEALWASTGAEYVEKVQAGQELQMKKEGIP
jgi:hypothetical protein